MRFVQDFTTGWNPETATLRSQSFWRLFSMAFRTSLGGRPLIAARRLDDWTTDRL
jgi:hypothetical protein